MSDAPAEEASRVRTLLLLGAGAIAVVALVMFVLLPLLSGGGEDPDDDVTVEDDSGEVVVGTEPTESPSDFDLANPDEGEGSAPAETFEVFAARDPFQQLVRGTGGGGAVDGGTTDPGTTDPGTTDPGTVDPIDPTDPTDPSDPLPPADGDGGDGDGDGSGGDGSGGDGSDGDGSDGADGNGSGSDGSDGNGDGSANVGGTTVTLVDVFTDDDGERKATVTVNGTGYTVGEGQTFGRRFRLLDISGSCSTMLFGDSRFTLCEGERIQK